ncbi:right-handed parallel beta-helix repeat-containing protein [Phenylobacterium sp. CCH9-H3]|uniref:calcium-binding protein n=1 Tax=Phenylobacterium sp. CCH9-H3 TaxID=1768774 RepID=UPI00083B42CD|nr:right-handed parallel beta-helix repeat-containing protein [Phenylobacterium sp. CCH9-H3]
MIITVNSSATLATALKAAQSGDTILLGQGTYSLNITNVKYANDITITSADAGRPAVITSLNVSNVTGLTIRDAELRADAGVTNPFRVSNSSDIHFENLNVHGSLDGNPKNDTNGFLIRSSTNVSIEDSEFHQLSFAVTHLNVDGLEVRNNSFHDLRADGVRGGGSSNVAITGNTFRDFYPTAADHPDAIQFWTSNTTSNAHDILIADNVIMRGSGAPMQGIFMGDEAAGIFYERVTIDHNLISGGLYHGINVTSAFNVVIEGNVVQGYVGTKSWIRVDDVVGATIKNNDANLVTVTAASRDVTQSNNEIVPLATDGGASALASWADDAPTRDVAAGPTSGLSVVGTAGIDSLSSGSGNDTLDGGAGIDVLAGGAGDDVYITYGQAKVIEAADAGVDTVLSTISFTLQSNVENLRLVGTANAWGAGNGLANQVIGSAANNTLFGRGGSDTVDGQAGDDVITGGAGDDRLTGGAGVDRFVFARGDGSDAITDFGAGGQHDVIDVSALLAQGARATLTQLAAGVNISFTTGDAILVLGAKVANLNPIADGWVF